MVKHAVVTALVTCISLASIRSQSNEYQEKYPPEKIYLQLDGKVYTTDNTIWFKCIVLNGIDHTPTPMSTVLYVELIGPDEKLLQKKMIKLTGGVANNFFALVPNYQEGSYLIRAYTEWSRNFGEVFFFMEYIHVYPSSHRSESEPILNVNLIEEKGVDRKITAELDPRIVDSLYDKKLKLFLNSHQYTDSVRIKRNTRKKGYLAEFTVPDSSQFVTLKLQTENDFVYSKTVLLNKDYLDLQFFPESGELVHGLHGKVGYKALDSNGKGFKISGIIVDDRENVVTKFSSNHLGMGILTLPNVDSTRKYFAKIKSRAESDLSIYYPLPQVESMGNVLTLTKTGSKIRLTATSNYLLNDSVFFHVSCRGKAYFDIRGKMDSGIINFSLLSSQLPDGILAFTMFDRSFQPVAERLYFNERSDQRINLKVTTDKSFYQQRDPITLTVQMPPQHNERTQTSLSFLVVNKAQLGSIHSTRDHILSYFLLRSELKGTIEDPGFYFRNIPNRHFHLDALMLTQGWRKYNYAKPVDQFRFQPEQTLSLEGKVTGIFTKPKRKNVILTMIGFSSPPSFQNQGVDSAGNFRFDLKDAYGHELEILIKSAKKSGRNQNYTIDLNQHISPAITFEQSQKIEQIDSTIQVLVDKNIERKQIEDSYILNDSTIFLDEIVVKDYRITPERKKVMELYGKPDDVIPGKAIEEKEEKWSWGLFSVLKYSFSDKLKIRGRGSYLFAEVIKGPTQTDRALFVVDGIPVKGYDYPLVARIPPSEVLSVEIIENAKNFRRLFSETYPTVPLNRAKAFGSVIAIYTKAGKGLFGAQKPVGILHTVIPVFAKSREFYAPKYPNIQSEDWDKPDLRALVHWDPKPKVNSMGRTYSTFYNADTTGEMLVIVEAISYDGKIGYQEISYAVHSRQRE